MALELDSLEIKVQSSAEQASAGIDTLTATLKRLNEATNGGAGLSAVKVQLDKLGNVKGITATLKNLSQTIKTQRADYSSLAAEVKAVSESYARLNPKAQASVKTSVQAVNALQAIKGTTIMSTVDEAAKSLHTLSASLKSATSGFITTKSQVGSVSTAFSALPPSIQRAITANAKLSYSNVKTSKSFGVLGTGIKQWGAKLGIAYLAARRVASMIGGWITESNAYVENLNLFTVAMGRYAKEAQSFAEHVSDVLGIDPSAWMRNQGVFMTLGTGFGVASDKAALMSKNLTQLGYDLSSFFNISVEDAMQKLQSGLSGELEPLRRLGYDLSQAKLQAIALEHGITKSLNAMSQAEKSQLRYYAILTQVTQAQGDMARTLEAPANQLRILQAQLTQAARALGNIFIPALNAVLPYAIAFLKVVRMVADGIASLFGFKLPEFDYSGLNGLAVSAEDATSGIKDATNAAKELKGQLAGFDEITLITQTKAGGASGGGASVPSIGDLGIDLPEYDFLKGLDDEISSRVNEIIKSFKRWLPVIKAVGAALLGALGIAALAKVFKGLAKLKNLIGAGGLSGAFTKVAAGVAGFAATFLTGMATFYDATLRVADGESAWKAYGEAMLVLVPVTAAVGAALKVFLGPVGWVIAAAGAVTGAIAGWSMAQDQLRKEMVEATFYNEQGAAITELANRYEDLMNAVIAANQPFLETHASIEASKASVREIATEVGTLVWAVQNGATSIDDALPKIQTAFEALDRETRNVFDNIYNNITRALAGSVGDAVKAAGGSAQDMLGIISQITGRINDSLDSLWKDYEDVYARLKAGDGDTLALTKELNGLSQEILKLSQEASPELVGLHNTLESALDINWLSASEASEALQKISEKSQEAKDSFKGMADALITDIETLKLNATPEELNVLNLLVDNVKDSRDENLKAIDDELNAFMGTVQTNLVSSVNETIESASEKWNALDTFTQMFKYGGEKNKYIEECVDSFKNDVAGPVIQGMIDTFGEDSIWADKALETLLSTLFGSKGTGSYKYGGKTYYTSYAKTLTDDIQGAILDVLPDSMKDIGKNMMAGVGTGITDNVDLPSAAIKDALITGDNSVFGAAQAANQSNSPSKLYGTEGANMMSGIALGISDSKNLVVSAMTDVLNELRDATARAMQALVDSVNATLSSIAAAASSVDINFIPRAAQVTIPRFSTGGFPEDGLFLANSSELVGRFSNGQTAVANNEQIVEGIAAGVSNANAEQNQLLRQQNELLMALLEKEWTLGDPSAGFGRFAERSLAKYAEVRG